MSAKIKTAEIRKKYEELEKDKLLDEVVDLIIENDKLKRKLRKYENPHTPSSKIGFDKPQALGLKVGRKKGNRSGHKGRTRAKDNPTTTIEVTADKNPATGNTNIKKTKHYEETTLTDFKIEKIVTLYKQYYYKDLNTGEFFLATHPDIPEKGIFGKNVLALASFLRFKCRVPFDKIASTFTDVIGIPMTTPTAMDICNRTADKVAPKYDYLKEKVRKEKAVNGDETSAKRNGVPGWLWGFFSLTIALFAFNTKRGGEIVEKILGKDFKGILGCDGWSTYTVFSEKAGILLQRCWAHLIREVKAVCKDVNGLNDAYVWINDIYDKVKEARKYRSREMREQLYVELVDELNRWIQVYSRYREMGDIITKVRNGKDFWFTCVLHLEIEPTNNRAERGLRAWVVLRKIIGCLRSEQGERTTEIMLSLFSTWGLMKINPYEELRAIV